MNFYVISFLLRNQGKKMSQIPTLDEELLQSHGIFTMQGAEGVVISQTILQL